MTPPTCLDDVTHLGENAEWRLSLVQPHIGGGRLSVEQLRAIEEHPEATAIAVSGLDQPTFETLIERHGAQFVGMYLWKCPRVVDLSPLEALPNLEYVAIYWNQRATRLWDFKRTPVLRGLEFQDFTRLHDLEDLGAARSLEELRFGDAVWRTSVFASLEPLEPLQRLQALQFNAKRIDDGKIQPLARLHGLRSLKFPPNQFTSRQVAWLKARLPEGVRCETLVPTMTFEKGYEYGGKNRNVLLVGRRMPYLNSTTDARRIDHHIAVFRKMVEEFRQNPDLQPD